LRCDDLRTRRHRHTDKTNAELAEKYGVAERTARNWRKAGCPFAKGQARVLGWMARRRYVPAAAKAKFAKQLRRQRFEVQFKAIFTDNFAAMRANILALKAHFSAQGLPVPDWTRGMFRAR
jgi:hypothetical protein